MASPGPGARTRRHLPGLAAAALLALTIVAAALLTRGSEDPSQLQLFLGRLHPLVVHLPIGFLVLAVLLEGLSWLRQFRRVRHAMPFVLVVSAASAVVAVVAGTLLGATGGYAGPTLDWHRTLGIGVAVGALAASALWYLAATFRARWLRRAYRGTLFASAGMLLVAGHLGGTLTRGPDYLTEHMPAPMRSAMALLPGEAAAAAAFVPIEEIEAYDHLVRPVLEARCVSCHGPDRQQGELRLDSPEAMLKGGDSGPAVEPGDVEESEMIRRVWLPETHEEHMPPRGRKPLTVVEADLLRWWVERGAPFEGAAATLDPPPSVQAVLEQIAGPPEQRIAPVLRQEIAAADSAALEKARALGVTLKPLAQTTGDFLEARCPRAPAPCGTEQVLALVPLADQIASLDLGATAVGDAELEAVGKLRHLTRLHLERTSVTDAGLAKLDSLRHLEYLNLHGTAVTDRGLQHLTGLRRLRRLYLWQTRVTPAGVRRLTERNPFVRVDLGISSAATDSLRDAARDSARTTTPIPES